MRSRQVRAGRAVCPGFGSPGVLVAKAMLLLGVIGWFTGCASTSESAGADTKLVANVGSYPPGPSGVTKPRVGVPPFKVTTGGGLSGGKDLNDLAADQMNTLLYKTRRFDVIERTQLKKLLDEQNLEGIVKPGELAKPAQVRGVDYLLLGNVTNLRVKRELRLRQEGNRHHHRVRRRHPPGGPDHRQDHGRRQQRI